jgi:GAF domain-containing protein
MKKTPKQNPASKGRKLVVSWEHTKPFPLPIPKDESKRMATLRKYHILDSPAEAEFDNLTAMAAHICGTPVALITLIDSDRQWFKSKVGISLSETSRDMAFCAHAIMVREIFVVPDASRDKRFAANPLVRASPKIRFYAGMPLVTANNQALGTLCVIDRVPRKLTREQMDALKALSRQVMAQLEARRQLIDLKQASLDHKREIARLQKTGLELESTLKAKAEFLQKLGQEMRTGLKVLYSLSNQISEAGPLTAAQKESITLAQSTCSSLLEITRQILDQPDQPPPAA